ncbi:MAG: MmgE/PrpD family protein [Pseudomonadota bacterium]
MKQDVSLSPTKELACFAARLQQDEIPTDVLQRITELYVDWAGSALSGKGSRAIEIIEQFSHVMGPTEGKSEILINRRSTSAFFAAFTNAASSHVSEQDDVHNGSVFHPATIVFPAALAVAQDIGASGIEFLTACVAGYEVGIRVGECLGRSHYKIFHTTGSAGTFAAAAACGNLLKLDGDQMLSAFGSAGTQSAGLWEFLRDGADSKQLHTAKSSAEGLLSAWIASKGFSGAKHIIEGNQGLAAGTSSDADFQKLVDRLGKRWSVLETSFKFHASCRHTHPAADALLKVLEDNGLDAADVSEVICHVHQAAIDVLGPIKRPHSVHQAKFCMAATLGLILVHRKAGLAEFEGFLEDNAALSFLDRISMTLDEEVNQIYPEKWVGKVTVRTLDGNIFTARVDDPKGDPGNTLSRDEIDAKARFLSQHSGAVTSGETDALMARLWRVADAETIAIFDGRTNVL